MRYKRTWIPWSVTQSLTGSRSFVKATRPLHNGEILSSDYRCCIFHFSPLPTPPHRPVSSSLWLHFCSDCNDPSASVSLLFLSYFIVRNDSEIRERERESRNLSKKKKMKRERGGLTKKEAKQPKQPRNIENFRSFEFRKRKRFRWNGNRAALQEVAPSSFFFFFFCCCWIFVDFWSVIIFNDSICTCRRMLRRRRRRRRRKR